MPRQNRKLHDGDLFKLSPDENSTLAEFVNTPGRGSAWRLYDRHGKGVLITHEQIAALQDLLTESLKPEYSEDV